MVFQNKKTKKITHIIEVETDPGRKTIVGSAITADYCLSRPENKDFLVTAKPRLVFVLGDKFPDKNVEKLRKREIIIIKEDYLKRCDNNSILIGKVDEVIDELQK